MRSHWAIIFCSWHVWLGYILAHYCCESSSARLTAINCPKLTYQTSLIEWLALAMFVAPGTEWLCHVNVSRDRQLGEQEDYFPSLASFDWILLDTVPLDWTDLFYCGLLDFLDQDLLLKGQTKEFELKGGKRPTYRTHCILLSFVNLFSFKQLFEAIFSWPFNTFQLNLFTDSFFSDFILRFIFTWLWLRRLIND